MTTTTKRHITPLDLQNLADAANAMSHSPELRKQHKGLNAALYRLIENYGNEIEQIAQNWGTDEF